MEQFCRAWAPVYDLVFYSADQYQQPADPYRTKVATLQDAWRGEGSDREVAHLHDTGDPVADAYADSVADLTSAWAKGSGRR